MRVWRNSEGREFDDDDTCARVGDGGNSPGEFLERRKKWMNNASVEIKKPDHRCSLCGAPADCLVILKSLTPLPDNWLPDNNVQNEYVPPPQVLWCDSCMLNVTIALGRYVNRHGEPSPIRFPRRVKPPKEKWGSRDGMPAICVRCGGPASIQAASSGSPDPRSWCEPCFRAHFDSKEPVEFEFEVSEQIAGCIILDERFKPGKVYVVRERV